MIVPDINLLVYAYVAEAPQHDRARCWLEDLLSETKPVGLAWAVVLGYVRITTSRAVLVRPQAAGAALAHVRAWLRRPQVQVLQPGPRHLDILDGFAADPGFGSRLTTDAHLAALTIEYQAELHSNDTDFSRFPGLRWHNPLA